MRGCRIALIALFLGPLQAGRAQAVPPPGAAVGGAKLDVEHWIEHRVIMGERLAEIARRYRVEVTDVAQWNGLDAAKPVLKAGQRLRILTAESAVERKRRSYVVREGDTWTRIANRFGVPLSHLRNKWNPGVEEPVPGETIVLFVEVEPRPDDEAPQAAPAPAADPAPAPAKVAPPPAKVAPPPAKVARAAAPAPAARPQHSPHTDALAAVVELPPKASASTRSRSQTLAAVVAPRAPEPARPSTNVKPDVHATASRNAQSERAVQASAKVQPPAKQPPVPSIQPAATSPHLPIVPVPAGALSVGAASRGRLLRGIQIPVNEALYTLRNPDNSWGSSHAIEQLQRAIARFRQDTGFDREILICDMSRKGGGRFRPHASHRSGRDVDIQLPVKAGMPEDHIPLTIGAVDWDAAWALVRALVSTGEVKYIFLSRSRQRPLYQAALRAGETKESLEGFIQFPGTERTALLRHSHGHVKHLHVRFKCAVHEDRCQE